MAMYDSNGNRVEIPDNVVDKARKLLLDQGIVTRNDIPNMDIRPYAVDLSNRLSSSEEDDEDVHFISYEPLFDGYGDYCICIYNPQIMTKDEVDEYMKTYVLECER